MQSKTIGIIHATSKAYEVLSPYTKTVLKDYNVLSFMDEGLVFDLNKNKELTDSLRERFLSLLISAEKSSPDLLLIACTSFIPVLQEAEKIITTKMITPYQAVCKFLVKKYQIIGILATINGAIPPAKDELQRQAEILNKDIKIVDMVVDGAFQALEKGDRNNHDEEIFKTVTNRKDVDCILISQFSMSYLEEEVNRRSGVPTYATLRFSLEHVINFLSSY